MSTDRRPHRSKPIEIPIETDDNKGDDQQPVGQRQMVPSSEHRGEATEESAEPAEVSRESAEKDERLLRLMAEFANFRKRVASEREQVETRAKAKLVRGLLGVLDAFEQMLEDREVESDARALLDGARLIYKQLWESLSSEGLEKIEALHRPFDPSVHEAVVVQPVNDPELDGVVLGVLQAGYTFGGQLLRPSQVVVGRYEESVNGRDA